MKRLDDMTEPELREVMTRAARAVADVLPRGTGFVLLASDFDGPGTAQYVGNGVRGDFIRRMRETADRLEWRQDVPRRLHAPNKESLMRRGSRVRYLTGER